MNIIHIRTSTEEQNPQNQLKDCLSIYKKEWGEYKVFEEKQSAFKDNVTREVFEEIRKLIKKGNVDHYIVWDFDRIYRKRIKFKEFLVYLKAFNTKLHSYRQDWIEDLHRIPHPWNEIVYELIINIYGHQAEDESRRKSDRVKAAVRKKDGITKSYKGNKWGRKQLSTYKKNQIDFLRNRGNSMREIARELSISVGTVHKYILNEKGKKEKDSDVR